MVAVDPNNESPDCPAIIATDRAGTLAAMTYLTGLGHRRIGHITGRPDLISANRRLRGYKEGLAALHKISTQLVVRDSCLSLSLDDDVATGISRGETLYAPVS